MSVYKDKLFEAFEFEGKGEYCNITLNGISLTNIESVDIHIDFDNIVLKLLQDGRENILVAPRRFNRGKDDFSIRIK